MATPTQILFVCWGNICRSPTAEGVMRRLVDEAALTDSIHIDSAGTSSQHTGNPPDRRAIAEARSRGINLSQLQARQLTADDWSRFDMLLAADDMVDQMMRRTAPEAALTKLHRMTTFGPDSTTSPDVPDPYYGDNDGFIHVYDLLERACTGLLEHITNLSPRPEAS